MAVDIHGAGHHSSRINMANRILDRFDALRDKHGEDYWWDTYAIMREFDEDTGDQSLYLRYRGILNDLTDAGILARRDKSYKQKKLTFKKVKRKWNRPNPFLKHQADQENSNLEEDDSIGVGIPPPKKPTIADFVKHQQNPIEAATGVTQPYIPHADLPYGGTKKLETISVEEHKEKVAKLIEVHGQDLAKLGAEITDLKAKLKEESVKVKEIHILKYDGSKTVFKNAVLPGNFKRVLDLARCRRNIMLVGPAGCGKSHTAELIATSLKLRFGSQSLTTGMSETVLLGSKTHNITKGKNGFQSTQFVQCYEEGGVFLFDEFDAADSNLLLSINTALANDYLNLQNRSDKPQARRHPDFIPIATANTNGRGANRMYVGRNQLDEATLDRFRMGMVDCDYDPRIELLLCDDGGKEFVPPVEDKTEPDYAQKIVDLGYGLRGTCQYIRYKIEQAGLRRIMSTRFISDAYQMYYHAEWPIKTIVATFIESWSRDEKHKLLAV